MSNGFFRFVWFGSVALKTSFLLAFLYKFVWLEIENFPWVLVAKEDLTFQDAQYAGQVVELLVLKTGIAVSLYFILMVFMLLGWARRYGIAKR
jgi:hypothetical protein